jgi:hypothetical protein
VAVGLLAVILGVATGTAAHAVAGVWTQRGPWLSMSYQDRSGITASGSVLYTHEEVARAPYGGTINGGYAGAQPRAMNSNGTVCAAGTMTYNAAATVSHTVQISQNCGRGAEYYSYGLAKYFNGSNYTGNYYSSPSPRVNF